MNYIKIKKLINFSKIVALTVLITIPFVSCDPTIDSLSFDLPEEGSKADDTPPVANFSYSQGEGDGEVWKEYTFSNLSSSATTYLWDFGDGNTSTDVDGKNTYAGEGTFTVTLTASDALGVNSVFSETIEIVEPEVPMAIVPDILEYSFEDLSLPDGTGDGRDSWRNDMGGVIQITSSPVYDGEQAAKFPSAGDRVAYQELTVSPNSDYILTYYYTMKTSGTGHMTVAVLAGGGHTDLAAALDAAIEEHVGMDQTSASDYIKVDIPFNSGANDVISILMTNEGVESRVDNISIEAAI